MWPPTISVPAAYAIKAARAAVPRGEEEAAGQTECQWQRDQVPAAVRALVPGTADMSNLFFPPAVSLTALSFATALAVVKPWGKVRRRS